MVALLALLLVHVYYMYLYIGRFHEPMSYNIKDVADDTYSYQLHTYLHTHTHTQEKGKEKMVKY